MTDQEITEIIAEKVMGWINCPDCDDCYCLCKDQCAALRENKTPTPCTFSPLTDDKDCMMAWDKFSEMQAWTCLHYHIPEWNADCASNNSPVGGTFNTNRRRAMCGCMVKAVQGVK